MKIIGISGSLRIASLSTALLKTAAALTPYGVRLAVYDGLGNLPHFNPELDREPLPRAVSDFRSQLKNSAGVIIFNSRICSRCSRRAEERLGLARRQRGVL